MKNIIFLILVITFFVNCSQTKNTANYKVIHAVIVRQKDSVLARALKGTSRENVRKSWRKRTDDFPYALAIDSAYYKGSRDSLIKLYPYFARLRQYQDTTSVLMRAIPNAAYAYRWLKKGKVEKFKNFSLFYQQKSGEFKGMWLRSDKRPNVKILFDTVKVAQR